MRQPEETADAAAAPAVPARAVSHFLHVLSRGSDVMRMSSGMVACLAGVSLALGSTTFQPPQLISGSAPLPPPQTIGWLEAVFQVHVTEAGHVDKVERLHGSDPLAALLTGQVTQWRFNPARDEGEPVSASVLVAAIYRPATLFDHAERGVPPPTVFDRRSPVPRPVWMPSPPYPPQAVGDGAVVVEILVTAEEHVASARVVRSAGAAFDASAVAAARRWQFSPAPSSPHRPTHVYVIFGFRQPIATPS